MQFATRILGLIASTVDRLHEMGDLGPPGQAAEVDPSSGEQSQWDYSSLAMLRYATELVRYPQVPGVVGGAWPATPDGLAARTWETFTQCVLADLYWQSTGVRLPVADIAAAGCGMMDMPPPHRFLTEEETLATVEIGAWYPQSELRGMHITITICHQSADVTAPQRCHAHDDWFHTLAYASAFVATPLNDAWCDHFVCYAPRLSLEGVSPFTLNLVLTRVQPDEDAVERIVSVLV
jgi:hypothetical protein